MTPYEKLRSNKKQFAREKLEDITRYLREYAEIFNNYVLYKRDEQVLRAVVTQDMSNWILTHAVPQAEELLSRYPSRTYYEMDEWCYEDYKPVFFRPSRIRYLATIGLLETIKRTCLRKQVRLIRKGPDLHNLQIDPNCIKVIISSPPIHQSENPSTSQAPNGRLVAQILNTP